MAQRAITDTLTLTNSAKIPQLGFGVYKALGDQCVTACKVALGAGYRHIDSAQFYENEAEVGEGFKQSGLAREDVFLATKILSPGGSVESSYKKCADSVNKIDPKTGYVDLFMIHNPNGGSAKVKEMWQGLERLHEEGKARSIGVSNFGIKHLEEMKSWAKVWPPHVNQVELHPWMQQREIVQYCHKNGIIVEAYCPLVRNQKAEDPTLVSIAKKHNATPNQVLIRYCVQKGWSPLPKSENPERIRANADIYGFDLAKEDMKRLDDLDQGPAGAIVQPVDN